jgi:NTE family protein
MAVLWTVAVLFICRPLPLAAHAGRPVVGLVLSGGGARGAAHVGVLQALEDLRVPVDLVVGTSMGSVIGGLYAAGVAPDAIESTLRDADWNNLLSDEPDRRDLPFRRKSEDRELLFGLEFGVGEDGIRLPPGIVSGRKVSQLLKTMTLETAEVGHFDDLPLPFRSVAADLRTGEMIVLSEGVLGQAIRASMSIPGAFSPVELDGRMLVDGGILRNLPIDVARGMGADVVIAVDVTPTGDVEFDSALSVYGRAVAIMTEANVREQLSTVTVDDVVITPDLGDASSSDFDRVSDFIPTGARAALESSDELRRYSVSPEEYAGYLERLRCGIGCPPESLVIDEIRVTGVRRVSPRIVGNAIRTRSGERLDLSVLREDLERVYALGDFESVDFRILREGGRNILAVDAREKDWGPTYLRLGMTLGADFRGESHFDFRAFLRTSRINALGAEWKTRARFGSVNLLETEIHQPLSYEQRFFVAPRIALSRRDLDVYDQREIRAQYRVRRRAAALDGGVEFGTYGEARIGAFYGHVDADVRQGPEELENDSRLVGGWTARLTLDKIDNPTLPRSGAFVVLDGVFYRKYLGSDVQYHLVSADVRRALKIGRSTVTLVGRAGSSLGSDIPLYEEFELGGFLSLSGYEAGQLRGPYFALGEVLYYRQITELPGRVGGGIYAGGSFEVGNVWDDAQHIALDDLRVAGSVFVSANSIIGPLYVALGAAQHGNVTVYLSLGGLLPVD